MDNQTKIQELLNELDACKKARKTFAARKDHQSAHWMDAQIKAVADRLNGYVRQGNAL